MNDLSSANEELVRELQELRQEHNSLKALFEKDITERKRAEEKLCESEERFLSFFELIADLACIASIDGYFQQLNMSWEKVLGYSRQELMQKSYLDFVHPDDRDNTVRIIREKLELGELVISFENRYLRKDGGVVWLEWTSQPIPEKGVTFAIARNITERKKNEAALQENELLLRETQEIARLGSFVWDIKSGFWTSSNILDNIFGIDKTYIRSFDGWVALIYPDWRETMTDYVVNEVLGKHQRFDKEYKIINRNNGKEVWVHGLGELEKDKNNQPRRLIGTITDITARKKEEQALTESEERYRVLLKGNILGILAFDIETHQCSFSNPAARKLFGYSEEEITRLNIADFHPGDSIEMVLNEFQAQRRGEKSISDALPCLRKDGTLFYADIAGYSSTFNGRNCSIGFITDVTERKQAQESLMESESALKQAQEIAMMGSWELDLINQKAKWSENCFILYGLKPFELEPTFEYFRSRVHPDDLHIIDESFENIFKFKKTSKAEVRILFPDGNDKWAQINIAPIVIEGELVALKGIQIDITDRKKAEDKIREKDIQFRKLSSNLPDLIYQFTKRPDGTYCVPIASEGIKNIFGCSPDDVVDDFAPIGRVIFPEDTERVINDIEYSAKHLTYFTCEFRVQIPGKPIQWIFSRSTPEKLADGSVTWYGFNANITEMKQTEMALVKAKEKAEESDRLKSAFLANMSHEIRTPMNGILGFAGLLKEPQLTGDEQQQYISIIEKSGKRMLNIINDIVDISKIESGQMEVVNSELNVNDLIEYFFAFFKREVEIRGLKLSIKNSLRSKVSTIYTDREKIYAILTNLVKNAIKFTEEGSIEFGCEIKGTQLEFFVKDTGIGIPRHRQEAIFERFIQADIANKLAHDGAGLGLSISKAYVEMLGGKIWVESEVGKGSTFYFTIPNNSEMHAKELVTDVPAEIEEINLVNKLRILIAEDDEDSNSLITAILDKFGQDFLRGTTGNAAVELCRNNPDIDLVLMDIRMPELDGYSATRQIRQFNKGVIIIAQTAFAMTGDREKAIAAGCNDYIAKPIVKAELARLIHKYFS